MAKAPAVATNDAGRDSDELTAVGLEERLKAGGELKDGRVARAEVVPVGKGMAGRVFRAALQYAGEADGAPASLIVKLQATPGATLDLASRLRIYEREAAFYRDLGTRVTAPKPRCYYAGGDEHSGRVLLLEDLAPAVEGDLVQGCRLPVANEIVGWLAEMHAQWWQSSELDGLSWLPRPNDAAVLGLSQGHTREAWRTFRGKIGKGAPRSALELGERLSWHTRALDELARPPRTLIHGDLRINNMMFGEDGRPLAIIDWQTAMFGRGALDLASFFVTNLAPEDRRTAERELLPAYVQMLEGHGVRSYSMEECWRDYRLAVIDQFSQVVILSSLLDVDEKLPDNVALVTGARLFAAVADLDLTRLMPPTFKSLARRGWRGGRRRLRQRLRPRSL